MRNVCRAAIAVLGIALGLSGCGSSDEVVDLQGNATQDLQSAEVKTRLRAARHFRDLKEIPPEVVPQLVKLLSDSDVAVRVTAAEALAETGTAGKSLVPELLQRRKAESDKFAKAALEVAIERISNAGLPPVPPKKVPE